MKSLKGTSIIFVLLIGVLATTYCLLRKPVVDTSVEEVETLCEDAGVTPCSKS